MFQAGHLDVQSVQPKYKTAAQNAANLGVPLLPLPVIKCVPGAESILIRIIWPVSSRELISMQQWSNVVSEYLLVMDDNLVLADPIPFSNVT